MSLYTDLQARLAAIQAEIAILQSAPSDTFNIGTAVVVAAGNNVKWYYVKTAEETWKNFQTQETRPLSEWILSAKMSNIGYFEVYELRPQPAPIYASA